METSRQKGFLDRFPPQTARVLEFLRQYESRNILYIDPDGGWPIVWTRAQGCTVWDAEGKEYIDFTAAFGVAAAGHANPRVVQAAMQQLRTLVHAMGDIHPHPLKAELVRTLSHRTFERWTGGQVHGKTILCNSGFEAVEAALKTAYLATGRERVVAFEGAYHGLGYGALNTTHREFFRSPFRRQLREFADFVPYPTRKNQMEEVLDRLDHLFKTGRYGAALIEPIQGRGGTRVPAEGFLSRLADLCRQRGVLLILDEIYTGFGRTGWWFACEAEGVVPDLICVGKAMTGGFPMSACIGQAELMDAAWPESTGEAIHTSTFLGHPVGCAMALAQQEEIERRGLVERARKFGPRWLRRLKKACRSWPWSYEVRGRGMMLGVEFRRADGSPATAEVIALAKQLLQDGLIVLPEGEANHVLGLTPPLILTDRQFQRLCLALSERLPQIAETFQTSRR